MKTCAKCGEKKPFEAFSRDRKNADGLCARCKECRAERRAANAGTERAERLKRRYGITLASFAEMLASQGGVCGNPGCRTSDPGGSGDWPIDHDHSCCPGYKSCGKCVRGLLCHSCNKGLGIFRDDPERLRGAIAYLERNAA